MRIVELIIDEKDEASGIDAVSVVESPAIESDFIALKKHEVELKEIDAEKRILMGAALIPNKQIYRTNEKKEEYYIYFSEATIRKASELFFINSNQNNATLEHNQKLEGMSVVESWIVEGSHDKSMNYGFNFPKGTWVISMKVNNDEIWNKVKLGEIKGFSIEGYFADKYEMSIKNIDVEEKVTIEKIKELITKSELKSNKVNLNKIDDIVKEFKIGSNLKTLADSKMRQCEQLASEAQKIYKEAFFELKEIQAQINYVNKQVAEIGLKTPDGLGAIGNTVSTMISDIVKLEPAVKRTTTLFP